MIYLNPILLDLDFITIKWYSVLILIAALFGILLATGEAKKFKISSDFMFNARATNPSKKSATSETPINIGTNLY